MAEVFHLDSFRSTNTPKHTCPSQREHKTTQARGERARLTTSPRTFRRTNKHLNNKMMCSRCFLLILVVYFLMDELCAFLLPDRLRVKRSSHMSDQDLSSHIYELSDLTELFPGNEGEMTRDWDPNPAKSPAFFSPMEQINMQQANNNRRKNKDNRRRITVPLDRIGSSHLSTRSRKEEPEDFKEYDAK
ncbi:uncharacterized protein isoform X2 [Danio rerio]|uniref:Uncharacterized protein isoform X2 n=2 Tax=Danio rerio TaxID=7955 RepID=A0AC58G4A0_DANRE